jgi:anti-sigma factor RsiW
MNTSEPQLNSLPDNDAELLSAYIDGQLSPAERMLAERRLAGEPRLRAELAELRELAGMLRGLEPLAPPRSFTLNPAAAPRVRRALPLAWFTQLGGGLAGLALVLLASLQILSGPSAASMAPAPMSQAAAAPTIAPQGMAAAEAAATAAPAEAPAPAAAAAPMVAATAAPAADSAASREAPTADAAGPGPSAAMKPAATPAIEASGSSSPSTIDLATPAVDPPAQPAQPGGIPPGLTLAAGVALLALALGWHLLSRRN